MPIRYATLSAEPQHADALRRLWRDNFAGLRERTSLVDRYRWAYEQNPAGPPNTVLAFAPDGHDPIGCGSIYTRQISIGGTALRAGIPADLAVERAHRTAAAALGIQRSLVADTSDRAAFFVGFPNASALPILQRVGYTPFAAARAWVKPLSAQYKIRPYVKSKGIARLAAAPIDLYLKAADAVRGRHAGGAGAEIVDRADARFDRLWERAMRTHAVAGERTSAYLNWRYADSVTARYRFFCLTHGGELLGYVAFTDVNDKVFVADLFALDMERGAEHLLLEFAKAMRREQCQSVYLSYAGNARFAERLARVGFIPRATRGRKLVALCRHITPDQKRAVMDPDNWYLFDGEMDV
jgi:hypothetical protein